MCASFFKVESFNVRATHLNKLLKDWINFPLPKRHLGDFCILYIIKFIHHMN